MIFDYFKSLSDLWSFTQNLLRFAFGFGSISPSETSIETSKISDSYEYVATSSINCMDNIIIFIANDI